MSTCVPWLVLAPADFDPIKEWVCLVRQDSSPQICRPRFKPQDSNPRFKTLDFQPQNHIPRFQLQIQNPILPATESNTSSKAEVLQIAVGPSLALDQDM